MIRIKKKATKLGLNILSLYIDHEEIFHTRNLKFDLG